MQSWNLYNQITILYWRKKRKRLNQCIFCALSVENDLKKERKKRSNVRYLYHRVMVTDLDIIMLSKHSINP